MSCATHASEALQRAKRVFLRYVLEGHYCGGEFFRTVTLSNQPSDEFKIQVIQARADPARQGEFLPPIPLERARDTGLRHLDGTLSMAPIAQTPRKTTSSSASATSRLWISAEGQIQMARVLPRLVASYAEWTSCAGFTRGVPTVRI